MAVVAAGRWLVDATCKMFYLVHPRDLALDDTDPTPKWLLEQGVPMFFLMAAFECAIGRLWPKEKGPRYRLNDFVASSLLGTFQYMFLQAVELAAQLLGLSLGGKSYAFVYDHFRLCTIDSKAHVYGVYVALFVGKDLGYYWMHRCLHEFHVLWAAHAVHHSGEDYNLGTGLRQGALQPLYGWPFYLPMALLGLHPTAFAAHAQLNTLYMFWIHTELVGRLPLGLEYVLNSPMAHRMHHRPPGNCNYAGVLIVWDRLFGTYAAETARKDYYGLAAQPQTFDPLALNSQHYARMASLRGRGLALLLARRVPWRFRCSVRALFAPIPPVRADRRVTGAAPERRKWDGAVALERVATRAALGAAFAATLVAAVLCLFVGPKLSRARALAGASVVCAMIVLVCQVCEAKPGRAIPALCAVSALVPAALGLLLA